MTFYFLLYIMVIMSLLTMVLQRHHVLMTLLSLEITSLVLSLMAMFNLSLLLKMDAIMFITLLTFGAIEASMGLALLVSMTRQTGTDMLKSLTMVKC